DVALPDLDAFGAVARTGDVIVATVGQGGPGDCARNAGNRIRRHRLAVLHRDLQVRAARRGRLCRALRSAPDSDQPLGERGGLRRSGPFTCDELGARDVLVPGELAVDDLDRLAHAAIWSGAGVLRAHSRQPVVDARAIVLQRTRLAVDADRAGGLPDFERGHAIDLIESAQHAHVP